MKADMKKVIASSAGEIIAVAALVTATVVVDMISERLKEIADRKEEADDRYNFKGGQIICVLIWMARLSGNYPSQSFTKTHSGIGKRSRGERHRCSRYQLHRRR